MTEKASHKDRPGVDGPHSLQDVEELLERWRRSKERRASGRGEGVVLLDPEKVRAQLPRLKLGPAPADLHERVRQLWASYEDRWASNAILSELKRELKGIQDLLDKEAGELRTQEAALRLRRERVENLRLLGEILDELLLRSQSEEGREPSSEGLVAESGEISGTAPGGAR